VVGKSLWDRVLLIDVDRKQKIQRNLGKKSREADEKRHWFKARIFYGVGILSKLKGE